MAGRRRWCAGARSTAWRRGRWFDSVMPPLLTFVGALPYFWLAMLALYLFAFRLDWFPLGHAYGNPCVHAIVGFRDNLRPSADLDELFARARQFADDKVHGATRDMLGFTRTVLERTPAQDAAWRPHPKSTSLGDLAMHLATIPRWLVPTLKQTELDLAPRPGVAPQAFESVEKLLAMFDQNVRDARAAGLNKSLVILGHARPLTGADGPSLEVLSDVAVNGFFVLSGYLIADSRVRTTLVPYLWRRFLRIYPAFLVSLLVVAAVGDGDRRHALHDQLDIAQHVDPRADDAEAPVSSTLEVVDQKRVQGETDAEGKRRCGEPVVTRVLEVTLVDGVHQGGRRPQHRQPGERASRRRPEGPGIPGPAPLRAHAATVAAAPVFT